MFLTFRPAFFTSVLYACLISQRMLHLPLISSALMYLYVIFTNFINELDPHVAPVYFLQAGLFDR